MPASGNQVRRILVVDDEPAVCDAIKMMLKFDGHEVRTANGSKEALSLLEQDTFDLVTVDYALVGMKGDELAAAIKQRLPHQPIIMITAYAEMLKSASDPLTGVDRIISKPFLLEDLRQAIVKALRKSVRAAARARQRAIGPDHEIGAGNFLFHRPLRGQALPDLLRRPPAREQSFALGRGGTGDANDFVKMGFGPGFEKQRNHHDGERAVFRAPDFNLGEPAFADARVENGFEFFTGGGIGKNDPRQFIPAKPAVRGHDAVAEFSLDFGEGGLAGLNELPREFVGVHHVRAAVAEEKSGGGFAHAHAAGQTADFHWLKVRCGRSRRWNHAIEPVEIIRRAGIDVREG
jgi:CheY-like chemotaxis protein